MRLLMILAFLLSAPSAMAQTSADLSCRASALRVEVGGLLVEPLVANEPSRPCADDSATLVQKTVIGPVEAEVLSEVTEEAAGSVTPAQATSLAARTAISGVVDASILFAEAHVERRGGECVLVAESFVGEAKLLDGTLLRVGEPKVIQTPAGALYLNRVVSEPGKITARAVELDSPTLGSVVLSEAEADLPGGAASCEEQELPSKGVRMTGGGRVENVSHGFTLPCSTAAGPHRLEVNWPGGKFHLESIGFALCKDSPAIDPGQPEAAFDTYVGKGTGRYNGKPARAEWRFTDAGEPGTSDFASIQVFDASGRVLNVSGSLRHGNHQAH